LDLSLHLKRDFFDRPDRHYLYTQRPSRRISLIDRLPTFSLMILAAPQEDHRLHAVSRLSKWQRAGAGISAVFGYIEAPWFPVDGRRRHNQRNKSSGETFFMIRTLTRDTTLQSLRARRSRLPAGIAREAWERAQPDKKRSPPDESSEKQLTETEAKSSANSVTAITDIIAHA
jgi:hypothetical protein